MFKFATSSLENFKFTTSSSFSSTSRFRGILRVPTSYASFAPLLRVATTVAVTGLQRDWYVIRTSIRPRTQFVTILETACSSPSYLAPTVTPYCPLACATPSRADHTRPTAATPAVNLSWTAPALMARSGTAFRSVQFSIFQFFNLPQRDPQQSTQG